MVKVPALIETIDDIRELPIRTNSQGAITLNDVASVRRTFKDPTQFSTINGEPAIAVKCAQTPGRKLH